MNNPEQTEFKLWPALLNSRCPRCRKGKIFANPMYSPFGQKALNSCPHCGLVYEREPGYFYAAMYVSYAFVVAELVTTGVGIYILSGSENPWIYILLMLSFVALLSPFNFRYGRVILMYFLTPGLHYKPELSGGPDIDKEPGK